jgi:hypothetical protein
MTIMNLNHVVAHYRGLQAVYMKLIPHARARLHSMQLLDRFGHEPPSIHNILPYHTNVASQAGVVRGNGRYCSATASDRFALLLFSPPMILLHHVRLCSGESLPTDGSLCGEMLSIDGCGPPLPEPALARIELGTSSGRLAAEAKLGCAVICDDVPRVGASTGAPD